MNTFKIVRFHREDNHPDNHKVIKTGLTEEEAQEHCQREDTRKKGVWLMIRKQKMVLVGSFKVQTMTIVVFNSLLKS